MLGGVASVAAAPVKPSWHPVSDTDEVLAGSRYVFYEHVVHVQRTIVDGGTLIDEQTGKKTLVVPPESPESCRASAIGGSWLAFVCARPAETYPAPPPLIELYRIPARQWRLEPETIGGPVLGIGADWIEIWAAGKNAPQPQFVFQNIATGRTRTLDGWRPGGHVVPNLSSHTLGERLCAPIRVPDAWEGNGEDWPGTVRFIGRYAIVGGVSREKAFGYLERCGTRLHRLIGATGPVGPGAASVNSTAVIWRNGTSLRGAYLPSLKRFTVDTTVLDRLVTSPYCCGANSYVGYLSSRTLYVLASPYSPQCDPTIDCAPAPAELYEARSPRQPRRKSVR